MLVIELATNVNKNATRQPYIGTPPSPEGAGDGIGHVPIKKEQLWP